jgi:hypothetical protein
LGWHGFHFASGGSMCHPIELQAARRFA